MSRVRTEFGRKELSHLGRYHPVSLDRPHREPWRTDSPLALLSRRGVSTVPTGTSL